jgi:hypothetical protein
MASGRGRAALASFIHTAYFAAFPRPRPIRHGTRSSRCDGLVTHTAYLTLLRLSHVPRPNCHTSCCTRCGVPLAPGSLFWDPLNLMWVSRRSCNASFTDDCRIGACIQPAVACKCTATTGPLACRRRSLVSPRIALPGPVSYTPRTQKVEESPFGMLCLHACGGCGSGGPTQAP